MKTLLFPPLANKIAKRIEFIRNIPFVDNNGKCFHFQKIESGFTTTFIFELPFILIIFKANGKLAKPYTWVNPYTRKMPIGYFHYYWYPGVAWKIKAVLKYRELKINLGHHKFVFTPDSFCL